MKLHLLGIPHTCTTIEYSHCAFTGKVFRFSPMMRSVGYEVIHYGNGDHNPGANKHIQILSEVELENFKKELLNEKYDNKNEFIGDIGDVGNIIYKEFNKRLKEKLSNNLEEDDIICCPFGFGHEEAIKDFQNIKVETGIGYDESYLDFRIFETNSWYQYTAGKQNVNGGHYWFVIPNYFDVSEWDLKENPKHELVYLGRICDIKGLVIITEIAKARPDLTVTICGQGDPTPYLVSPNIKYKEPIFGKERSDYLGNAIATIMPTIYNEPFGGVTIESHLCGTPVLGTSYGSFTETIEHRFNGYRCHTLGDFLAGIENIENGMLNRKLIREKAIEKYDMYNLAKKYDEVFQRLLDLKYDGWYSHKKYF